ncbi:hypothetical protein HOLleu_14738 [Holothuria leucospilota]|uniref:Uncharacterized protein n=1 Tax=Holothuria leucospilota TaxID=206669 RepID=A0A9Q1C6X2_HOLLE|nr:hypothetical protein HOLleu_14738 [Holothuria leucospilota]
MSDKRGYEDILLHKNGCPQGTSHSDSDSDRKQANVGVFNMYLTDKIFFLKEALEADVLKPVRRESWFRRHKDVLMDCESHDWEEPEF